jgi:succinoglycan biosynthesis transport protein ExoP
VTDAAILAKITGGALLVVGADKLHRQQLADGLGSLEDVGARVLGVVLNRLAHKKQGDAYSYYDYATAPTSRTKVKTNHKRAATSEPTRTRATRAGSRRSASRSEPSKASEIDGSSVQTDSPHDSLLEH